MEGLYAMLRNLEFYLLSLFGYLFGTLSLATRVLGIMDRLTFLKDLSGCARRMYWREQKWRLEDMLGGF